MNKRRKQLAIPIDTDEAIEYVIYCRKSTDESSNKQVASIPRQITECLRFAKREGLTIAKKPKDFYVFESTEEAFKEKNCSDLDDRAVYEQVKNFYVVKEQKSAKTPHNRKKWGKIVQLVEEGKIRGILSYSPDRQARNMVEGGQIIDFVDQEILGLKYANFHFEPNASGKMMLGIWFVFSKQYSDKLSEDVTAGNNRATSKGETIGYLKYGYKRGDDSKWKRDARNYDLIRKAFDLKLHEKLSDEKIAKIINAEGFIYKWGNTTPVMTHQKLSRMWTDPFYYGIWIIGNNPYVDLREVDSKFEPMITQSEHEILCLRSRKDLTERRKRSINDIDELGSIRVINNSLIKDKDGNEFSLNLPSKNQRFIPKLKKALETNPKATLADFVKPHQIQIYNSKTKKGISFDKVDKYIRRTIKKLSITEDDYVAYLLYTKKELKRIFKQNDIERQRHQLRINSITSEMNAFLTKNLSPENREIEEEIIYQDKKRKYKDSIKFHEEEINKISNSEEIELLNAETIVKFMKNAVSFYDKCNYVQKAKIIKLLLLNIVFHSENQLRVEVKPELASLFCRNGGPGWN